ncbi:AIR synthase-related protein [Schizophyllum fasciatum]
MEIWCKESQERYVLAFEQDGVDAFQRVARRERCPYALVGTATAEEDLVVTGRLLKQNVIRLPLSTLFSRRLRTDVALTPLLPAFDPSLAAHLPSGASLKDRLTLAGDRSFLITSGDRSITGLVARDQMVGPWQIPVADVAGTRASHDFAARLGEAMAMGERTSVAVANAPASARMAVAEALANLAAAAVDLPRTKLNAMDVRGMPIGSDTPDVDDAAILKALLDGCQRVRRERPELELAYHDRSDGGLFTTLAEMAFAEELGAVFQVRKGDADAFATVFPSAGVTRSSTRAVGKVDVSNKDFPIRLGEEVLYSSTRANLQNAWAGTSFRMLSLRDNPDSLRSFDPLDVHILISGLLSGTTTLVDVRGFALPSGFSYGDDLGAKRGWAASAQRSPRGRGRAVLRELVPGAEGWQAFRANTYGGFEGRVCEVEAARGCRLSLRTERGGRCLRAHNGAAQASAAAAFEASAQVAPR